MPKDHFWNKRSNKKESTLDGSKANGLTGNGDITKGGSSRNSQKGEKTNSTGTGRKHLFGWGPIRKKSPGDDSKVPRSVSSSALSEARTMGFKRTASNGEVEQNRSSGDYLMPVDHRTEQRQRHSSDRSPKTQNGTQVYSLPVDTIKKVNGENSTSTSVRKSPSPVSTRSVKPPQQDYTEPWSLTATDAAIGTSIGTKSRSASSIHHIKTGSSKKKESISSPIEPSVSPSSTSPENVTNDVSNDDYEEPWDKYTGGMPPFRRKSKDKVVPGRISPKAPAKLPAEMPNPPFEINKPLPPLPPLPDDEDDLVIKELPVPSALPKRSVSLKLKAPSVSDYSIPVDTKRMSDTTLPILKPADQCSSHGGSSSEELQSPSPPPLPVRYVSTPVVNTSLPLQEQPWYHHKLSRSEAEAILGDKEDFSFLVRESESSRDPYSLSIRNMATGFMHLKIARKNGMYIIGQFSKPFKTVPEAIEFYTRNKLTLKGADHKQLKYPVHATDHK